MYFILVNSQIVEQVSCFPSLDELEDWANQQNAPVDVIEGEYVHPTVYPAGQDEKEDDAENPGEQLALL
jgi:hypothetical protein